MSHEPAEKAATERAHAEGGGRKHDHAVAGAATLSGAVTGAVIGAIAGPAGAVAGGVVGTAVGAIAGLAMEREEIRHDAHDRELDDDIGVTQGDIGEPEEHKRPSHAVIYDARQDEARAKGEEPT